MSASLLLSLAVRNLARNLRRSALTAVSVLLCVSLLIVGIAWLNGVLVSIMREFIATTGAIRIVHPEYSRKERLLPLHLSIENAEAMRAEVAEFAEGGAHPRITFGALLITDDDRSAPGIGRAIEVDDGLANLRIADRLYAGRMLAPPSEGFGDEIVVGRLLAEELSLSLDDEVTMLGKGATDSIAAWSFKVVGLFDAGSGLLNRGYYIDLGTAQSALDMEGQATELTLFGASLVYERQIPSGIKRALQAHDDLVAEHWLTGGGFASVFDVMRWIIGTIAGIVMFVSALGVLNTMMMAVMERRKEFGVILAQGAPLRMLVAMVLLEAALVGFFGAAGGTAVGTWVAYMMEIHGIALGEQATRNLPIPVHDVIYADVTGTIVLIGFATGLVVSLVGAVLPALRAVRTDPADALRIDA